MIITFNIFKSKFSFEVSQININHFELCQNNITICTHIQRNLLNPNLLSWLGKFWTIYIMWTSHWKWSVLLELLIDLFIYLIVLLVWSYINRPYGDKKIDMVHLNFYLLRKFIDLEKKISALENYRLSKKIWSPWENTIK